MNFRIWLKWFKSLHITKKWFIVLILIRPIVDNFYELKETSSLASPLYIVGVLTPILIFLSMTSNKLARIKESVYDSPFKLFAYFLVGNCLVFYATQLSISSIGDVIKYITPALIFFYCRMFVQSKADLDGILFACLLACIFPLGMMFYESIFNPIAIEYVSEGRGGGSRIRGAYADIMNYAIYIEILFITMSYYFLTYIYNKTKLKITPIHIVITLLIVFFGLTKIKQVSTWAVTLTIFAFLMLHNLRNIKGLIVVFFVCIIGGLFFAESIYNKQIAPLIDKEIKVVDNENDKSQALNGRMSRWEKYFEIWEQMPILNHFIGVPSSNFKETDNMISAGMHSDYVRLLFLTGFIGVGAYTLYFILINTVYFQLLIPEKFILISTTASLLLWSVSTIPTLYAPWMYFMFPVVAYASLPKKIQYS